MRDGITHLSPAFALHRTLVQASAVNGLTVDLRGTNAVAFFATVLASADTINASNPLTFSFEDADDDGAGNPVNWSAVPALKVIGDSPVVTDNADKLLKFGVLSIRRYARVKVTPTGTHTAGSNVSVLAAKSHLQAEGKGW